MVFDNHSPGLLGPTIGVEPARRLGQPEHRGEQNAGEQGLQPERHQPAALAVQAEGAAHRTARDDRTHEPEGVVQRGHRPAVSRVADLDHVYGPRGRDDGHAKANKEAADHELAQAACDARRAEDYRGRHNNGGADEHAHAAAPRVRRRPHEGQGGDAADLVDGADDAGPQAVVGAVKEGAEGRVGEETVEEGAVVAVHGRAEEADQAAEVQDEGGGGAEELRRLLEEGLVEGRIAADDPDGGRGLFAVDLH